VLCCLRGLRRSVSTSARRKLGNKHRSLLESAAGGSDRVSCWYAHQLRVYCSARLVRRGAGIDEDMSVMHIHAVGA
jgi:hypothetical protein